MKQNILLDSELRKKGFLFSQPLAKDDPEFMAGISELNNQSRPTFTAFIVDALTAEMILNETFPEELKALQWLNEKIASSPYSWEFQEASTGCGNGNCKEGSCAKKCKGKNCEDLGSVECRIL